MDSSLIRQHKEFQKRAYDVPVVENRPDKPVAPTEPKPKKKKFRRPVHQVSSALRTPSVIGSATAQFKTKNKFGVLKIIMDRLKARHMASESEALSLEELLEQTGYSDVQQSIKSWLPEALHANQKVTVAEDEKYLFKPLYQINNREKLLNLLRDQSEKGLGAVKLEDVRESYPRADKTLEVLATKVISLTRMDKDVVLFYNSPEISVEIDEDFKKLWRSISVEGLSDLDIEKHLHNAGISSMQGVPGMLKRKATTKRKSARARKQARLLNDHLDGSELLKNYNEDGQLVEPQNVS
ncbi:general transcription factor IIE subunit 2-like [Corticium candelabrum]|uniref:general transcription factor IIE subunit 2-like n=1 Tax=Corticium candelabrum TaxID=121492 RepID=UPI002E26D492|nr:general transcription factor IIE subunit 2-like [Corticium candelabrum]